MAHCHHPDATVNIALVLTVETAQGMREALPHVLDALCAENAGATVCLHLGRDAGAPADGRWRERARWHGWASLWRGRVWPGESLARLAPTALAAVSGAGCEAGLHLGATRSWRGELSPERLAARVTGFRQLAGLDADAPFTVSLPDGRASWPLLRLMQAHGAGALTGFCGRHAFMPSHRAELLATPVTPVTLPGLADAIRAESGDVDAALHTVLAHDASDPAPALCMLDVERMGGVWLPAFQQLLAGWREQGRQIGPVSDWLAEMPALPYAEVETGPRHVLTQGQARFMREDAPG